MNNVRNSTGTFRLSCHYNPELFEGSGETFGCSLETRAVRVLEYKKKPNNQTNKQKKRGIF